MKAIALKQLALGCLLGALFATNPLFAQTVFKNVFDEFLTLGLEGSPGEHGSHFKEAAELADKQVTSVLNSLIAGNVSSFPLSSTSAGLSFDFSTGQPVSVLEGLGPIFAETGRTLGKGKVNVGLNYNYLNLSKIRGLRTEDMQFSFTHVDVEDSQPGLGDSPNESDIMDVNLGLDVDASIFAFFVTMGITNNLDIGIAVPVIDISMSGRATAVMNSFTFAALDSANHHFGDDPFMPVLERSRDIGTEGTGSFSGIGDIAVRLKYSFLQGGGVDLAALVDARLPTGDTEKFLGTENPNVRFMGIMSKKMGDFRPHLNLGFEYRGSEFDSNELEFAAGFDQKVAPGLTFALDILGEIDIEEAEQIQYTESRVINVQALDADGKVIGNYSREVKLSNIPELTYDNVVNAALGLRYAPSEKLFLLGNLTVPLNNGGLRSDVAITLGLAVSI